MVYNAPDIGKRFGNGKEKQTQGHQSCHQIIYYMHILWTNAVCGGKKIASESFIGPFTSDI